MDLNEFTQQVQPRRKRSRLLKHKTEIAELKDGGYTDQQIRDWLAKNDLNVSREAVRKFIKIHLAPINAAASAEPPAAIPAPLGKVQTVATEGHQESQAEKMRRRVREQQQEARMTRFSHDRTGNNIKE